MNYIYSHVQWILCCDNPVFHDRTRAQSKIIKPLCCMLRDVNISHVYSHQVLYRDWLDCSRQLCGLFL